METKVTEFDHKGREIIKIQCSSMGNNPYLFTIVVDVAENLFDPISLMESLSNSPYDEIVTTIRQEVLDRKWATKDGRTLQAISLAFKLRNVVSSLTLAATEAKVRLTLGKSYIDVSGVTATGSQMGSQQTGRSRGRAIVPSQSWGASATPTPLSPLKKKGLEKKTDKPKPKKDLLLSAEDLATSLNSVLVELPKVNKVGEALDFNSANRIYQGFFADCQEKLFFKTNGQPKKISVDVTRCKPAPAHWTIRAYEKRGMEEMKNYLINMPDRTQKQTLCVMLDTAARPQQEDNLRGCTFWIINGQHSVAASKSLIEDNASEELLRDFKRWDAYMPTWASNIIAARTVWKKYGKPQPKHAAAGATGPKRNPASKTYDNFVEAIRERFAMIDLAKHQALVAKKGGKNTISLTNELKIIKSSDETWDLWKEVIASAACGGLIDPDTKEPHKNFHEKKGFVPDKDGTLPREFFKWLGNLSEADLQKLCKHILHKSGPSRKYINPKVVIKQNTNVLEDCYSVREWVQRRKREAVAKEELNKIKPTLHLIKRGVLDVPAWKHFKKAYHVSKESKHVLLDWGIPDSYWTNSRATQYRNQYAKDLSPYAVEFFRNFLQVRDGFQSPSAQMWFLPFMGEPRLAFGSWPFDVWRCWCDALTFGIIDFWFLPTYKTRHNYTLENPFFMEFFQMIDDYGQPQFNDVRHWLLICGDDEDFAQVLTWVERNTLSEPLSEYRTPDHPLYKDNRKFNETKYALYPSELRMEFYLQVHDTFCKNRGAVYQLCGGTKPLLAATVICIHFYTLARVNLNLVHLAFNFIQMFSILAFVVADDSDLAHMIKAQSLGLILDPIDFNVDAYYVNKERFPEYGRAVRKGKGRAVEEGDDVELEEDAPIQEQTPSSSATDISNDGDAPPSDPVSQTASEGGVGRRLDFPDVDITCTDDERPGSAPELGSGSGRKTGGARSTGKQAQKKKKVNPPARQASPLGRAALSPDVQALHEELQASRDREKDLEDQMAQQKMDIERTVQATLHGALQGIGNAAIFPNASPVLPNVQPIGSAPPTSRVLKILGSPTGGAKLPESDPSPASVLEPSHHCTDQLHSSLSDDSIVLLQCPGHEVHEEVDDLPILDDVVMAQTADEPVRTNMDLDVTAQCALTLPTCVEVIPDNQPQDSLGSMGPVEDQDVVEEQAEDVQVCKASGCDVSSSEELSPVPTRPQSGWLNVVLDLNGILCSSTPKWPRQSFVSHDLNIHSASKPAVVRPKLVCVRPNCSDFLPRLSTFATITVWSSMKTSTTKMICDYLFDPIRPVYPLRILGQGDCQRVPMGVDFRGRPVYMKEPGTQKEIFLTSMSDGLFRKFGGLYSEANTIFIDDSLIKHCQNNSYNVLLLSTWNNQNADAVDDRFLLKKLLPYLDNACRASVDSLNNAYGCGPSLRSKGLLLQSVATAQSTMDYSTMAVDEGIVDSPVNLSVPKTLKSPSSMRPRTVLQVLSPKRQSFTPTKRALYNNVDDMPSPPPATVIFDPLTISVSFLSDVLFM
ncbi:hypothetical protein KC19_VG143100 [Ceratodon purpureus]|uniref:FCP1 homology domain-containing protein n=1 Tax=Ceratodon purpureus TaxID=3225 RepID=A0A8T0HQM2_CERPU|nr:hypothetical protein KC19_VG143100 [Ceratodon purpureus]